MDVYKVLILKTGKVSLHPALGPAANLVEGDIEQFDENTCKHLIKYEWAQWSEVDTEKEVGVDPDESDRDPKELLYELIEDKEEPEAKAILQDWGEVKSGKKVSKAKSVENMIFEIVQNLK